MNDYHPLADILRPNKLEDFVGQSHLVCSGKPIKLMIESQKPYSTIFWGPPCCGKTTLARIIANSVNAEYYQLSAVSAGKKDVKEIVDKARNKSKEQTLYASENNKKYSVLFLDEIHRFNKAQQDFLLPYVEDGTIILIGASTENPSFEVISALLSRSRVFVLEPLMERDLLIIINKALKTLNISMDQKAKSFLAGFANGDGRTAINILEIADQTIEKASNSKRKLTFEYLKDILQKKALIYDKGAQEHYNTISAFIKSMRASDVNAGLYYLARMVESGEDPLFIARRMVVFASEDIGLAVPTALVVANAVFRACETVGFPECQENLAAGVAYMCQCKKDRSAYDGYMSALADVKEYGNLPIPMSIRNAPTKLMKELGYGKGYEKYPQTSLLPERLKGKKYLK